MLRKLASRVGLAVVALSGGFFVGMGCVSSDNERTLELAIGTRCTLNSDCTDPNVCVFGTCHAECATSADCAHDERCVKGEKGGASVCQLPSESTCSSSADCSGTQVCGVDGECRDGCKSTSDCLTGQVCTQGTCADQSELDPGTQALPEDPDHVGEGQPCTYNTDCPEDLACIESTCAFQCNGDKDCGPGQACVEHFCTVKTPIPLECNNSSECGSGFLCVQNKCVEGCGTDADCATGTRCFGGKCSAPVFDAAYSPDTISANDTSLLAIYNGHILRCPNSGCTPANVEQLFDTVYLGGTLDAVIALGGSAPREQLFADGPATIVINSNYGYFQEDVYGCLDLMCEDYVESYISGIAEAKTMRAHQGGVVVYTARDDGKGGMSLVGCTLAKGSTDCVFDFGAQLSTSGNDYPSTMAVAKGATPADDEIYVGWTSGRIERYSVTACQSGGACTPTLVAQITDGIGQPVEVTTLRLSGTDLFFLASEGGGEGGSSYIVDRCVSSSCTPTLFHKGFAFFNPDIAVGGGSVFISDDGNVWKQSIAP